MFQASLFLRNTEQHNNINYISLQTIPLCNYTFPPATVKVIETFQEIIL